MRRKCPLHVELTNADLVYLQEMFVSAGLPLSNLYSVTCSTPRTLDGGIVLLVAR